MTVNKQTYRDIDVIRTWSLKSSLNFTRYMFKERFKKKFITGKHHIEITEALDKVLTGEITRLIINIAPRYSKTEIAVKSFISMGLAINPKAKFIHLSYSDDLVRDSSSEIQDIINEDSYQRLFDVTLASTSTKKWTTTAGGGLYAVSSSGQVTGFGAGVVDEEELSNAVSDLDGEFVSYDGFAGAIVIDDPIKPDEAMSALVRNKVNLKFETTIRNRVNSRKTPIIIIMQRLHEDDLCGYLQRLEPEVWTVVSLPCIYTDEKGEEQALWPHKHTLEELHKLRKNNSFVFDTQYMQDPKPLAGLMYEQGFRTYETMPISKRSIKKNYTDTADTGNDYLCSICYDELENGNYVTDILYTQKPMEYTEPKTAEMITKNETAITVVESNNGGRGFARNVETATRVLNNTKTRFKWFFQGSNKAIRIFTKSGDVQNMTYFPKGWELMWPEFHRDVTGYMKTGKNEHDDGPDTLTGMVEFRGKDTSNVNDYKGLF